MLTGAGFAAMGSAIGVAAREVRASALLAFALTLPIAFLSLVPSGTVSETLYDAIRIVTGAFPFRPALDALSAAPLGSGPTSGLTLLHLAILLTARVLRCSRGARACGASHDPAEAPALESSQ